MSKKNSIQSPEQNALLDELLFLGKETLESVWAEDGKLHDFLNQRYFIQQNFADNAKDETNISDFEAAHALKLVKKRIEALENPSKFFKAMVKCHSLIESKSDSEDSLTLGYLADEDYPEHFAWAIDILLRHFFRGRKNKLNTLIERFKDSDNHQPFKEILLRDISPSDLEHLQTITEEQDNLHHKLVSEKETISDFDFLNNAYGLAHLNARENDADCAQIPYYDYNVIVNSYLDSEDDDELKRIYARLIAFTDYEATINSLTQHSAFDIALFEHETALKLRLKVLKSAEEEEEPFNSLNLIEESAISSTLKKIAEYRYSNSQEQKLADTYEDINDIFTSLLEGEINEVEFQVNLDKLITKYEPGTSFWTKIIAYISAIADYITNKDRETLPRYWHLDKLKAYKGEFGQKFINYLNKLSHDAKKEFLLEYASKLELKLNPSSNPASPNHSNKSDSNEDKADDKSESADEVSSSASSLTTSKASFWFKKCRDYTGNEDISELMREAMTIEKALVSPIVGA